GRRTGSGGRRIMSLYGWGGTEPRGIELGRGGMADDGTTENTPQSVRDKVRQLPTTPGVYLMKNAQGLVIYIGKAVNLRNRVGSYCDDWAAVDRRTADPMAETADLDVIQTDSGVDALLLEARLVKDIQPRFNEELKDDKSFPYLQIFTREDFPRVEYTRSPRP